MKKPTLAYIDAVLGLVPCKVTGIIYRDDGALIVRVKVTARRPGYEPGGSYWLPARKVLPRHAVGIQGGKRTVRPYTSEDYLPA